MELFWLIRRLLLCPSGPNR